MNGISASAADDFKTALALQQQWELIEAEAIYRRILARDPDHLNAWVNLGAVMFDTARPAAAIKAARRALAIDPDHAGAHVNLAHALLAVGQLQEGWSEYEWRWKAWGHAEPQMAPQWTGQPLQGRRILLFPEQGIGDYIQFMRYAPMVAAAGGEVVLGAPAGLERLVRQSKGVASVVGQGDQGPAPAWQCPVMSLPLAFGTRLETIPWEGSYLFSDRAQRADFAARLGPKTRPRVGLAWSGAAIHKNDRNRSITFERLGPLLSNDIDWVCLQNAVRPGDAEAMRASGRVSFHGEALQDLSDTAALLDLMDLVITVDTSLAHLAGAMGKPVWVLLPYAADWRWLTDRTDSPWYPTARLFRQASQGDWTGVLEDVRGALGRETLRSPVAAARDEAEHLLNEALALQTQGRPAEALEKLDRLVALEPDNVDAHMLRSGLLLGAGRLEAALDGCDRVVALRPDLAGGHANRGTVLIHLNRPQEALASIEAAIALDPASSPAYGSKGLALRKLGRAEAALEAFDRAVALDPNSAEAHNNRGNALHTLGRHADAVGSFDQAIEINPAYPEAHSNRGNARQELGRADDALASYEKALALKPDLAEAHIGRGNALLQLRRPQEALACYERAMALKPDFAIGNSNRALALEELNRPEEAIEAYGQAIALEPDYLDARVNRSFCLLRLGRFEEGWREYEWRLKAPDVFIPTLAPQWKAQPLKGARIFLYPEQGAGDYIQFLRYAPMVAASGGRVVLGAPPGLARLAKGVPNVEAVVANEDRGPPVDWQCPLMSLPLAFATRLETIPADTPYLFADPARRAEFEALLGGRTKLRVGLAWSGNPGHRNDHNRSIAFHELAPLLGADVDWVCLQNAVREGDVEAFMASGRVGFHGREMKDFSDTAALIATLDLVITVDTSVAHLAGALGKPVWILLPYNPDWRWMLERGDSPWYPTVRLFRQRRVADWAGVIAEVAEALAAL